MIAWLAKEADRSHACVTFFPPDAVINKSSVDVLVLTVAYSALVNVSAVVINICFHCVNLQRYIALEDSQDGEKKDLQCRLVTLESHTRQLELKTRNYADQSKLNLRFICNDTHTRTPCEQHPQFEAFVNVYFPDVPQGKKTTWMKPISDILWSA